MNRKPRALALAAVSLVCIMILAACGDSTPVLRYITITPATANIGVGTTQQFTATGSYSNGSTTPNMSVTWGSSTPAVATIDSTGVATAVATGTTTITATAFGITATPATLNVNQLTTIVVAPANASVAIGATQVYTATGTFKNADGSTPSSDITAQVTWNSSTPTVATIDATGKATGVASGATAITAKLDGVTSNSANLTVGAPVAVSLMITPATATIAVGNTTSFTVSEKWSDGSMHDPPAGAVAWTSDAPADAWVIANSATTAVAAGFAVGTAKISATEGTLTAGTTTLTVVKGTTHFAYVANSGDSNVGEYTVNATTAPYLTALGTATTGTPQPTQVILAPNGLYLYSIATTSGATNVTVFKVAADGTVSDAGLTPTTVSASNLFVHGTIDPYGRFLYITDNDSGATAIYAYQISPTDGSLTAVAGSPFSTNVASAASMVIDHTGTYLYAVNEDNNTISSYKIDQTLTATGGALTPLAAQPTIATGTIPTYATIDPAGAFIYVPNNGDGTITTYSIGTDGTLTNKGNTTVSGTTVSVLNVGVDPADKYLYVVDETDGSSPGALHGYTLTAGIPSATEIGTPAATGVLPQGIAIDPTSTLIAVENTGDNTISLFTIGSGGALTAQTPVPAGNLPNFVIFSNAP